MLNIKIVFVGFSKAFPYSPLGKALEKPTKTIQGQEKKETETLKF